MTRWRVAALVLLLVLVGGPLAVPLLAPLQGATGRGDLDRLGLLALNTLVMVGGTGRKSAVESHRLPVSPQPAVRACARDVARGL